MKRLHNHTVLLVMLMIIPAGIFAQCKTYIIGVRKDTLNCTDANNLKQGKWVVKMPELRGEPGYEAEGIFRDDKKEGLWRLYNLDGDLIAMENYKWGYKNGSCQYFNVYGLQREEQWKATNPENPYDTIDVPDIKTDTVYKKIIKVDASTVRQGLWKYFNPATGEVIRTEEYILDELKAARNITTSAAKDDPRKLKTAGADSSIASSKEKPPEVLQYEKKNSKKKKIKVRDGVTGVP